MEGTPPQIHRIAVLTSGHGRGSNLRAMHEYFLSHALPVKISFTTASRAEALVAELCLELQIVCHILNPKDQSGFETQLLELVQRERIELLALAGFMRQLSADFLKSVNIPILNIHPALLPKYGGMGMFGMHVHEAVLASGDKVSGATVHLVDPLYDHGGILYQQLADITDCSTAEEIAAKVLKVEHQIYAPAIWSYLSSENK
jgi:phosphoribosylglycinamide formyltransferase 1